MTFVLEPPTQHNKEKRSGHARLYSVLHSVQKICSGNWITPTMLRTLVTKAFMTKTFSKQN